MIPGAVVGSVTSRIRGGAAGPAVGRCFDGHRAFPGVGQQGSGGPQRQRKTLGPGSIGAVPAYLFSSGLGLGLGHQLLGPVVGIGDPLLRRLVGQFEPGGQLVALTLSPLGPFERVPGLVGGPFDGLGVALSAALQSLDGNHH